MKNVWMHNVIHRPWLVLLLGLVLIVAASSGAGNLYFRGDYKVFFEKDNPQRVAYDEMQAIFSKNENASIIIAPESGDVFNQRTLKLIADLTEEAWQIPMSSRVDSITNYQHTWAENDDLVVEKLVLDAEAIDDNVVERARRVALSEPNLVNLLVSEKGDVAVVAVTVNMPDGDKTEAVKAITNAAKGITDQFSDAYPDHAFYHTGIVLMNNSFATESEEDFTSLVPIMFGMIVLVLWLLLRTFSGVFATVVVIITAITTTMGLAGWMGYFLSTATVNVPTVVMTLAVADCVHVVSSMLFAMREGKSKREAIEHSMSLNLMPIFVTSATTAIGFLTLNFSNVPVLADLGNLTALGVLLAFAFSVTLLPAMLALLPMKAVAAYEGDTSVMAKLADWVTARHRKILPFTLVVIAGAVYFAMQNTINDVPTEYFDQTTEFRQSTNFQEAHISGMSTMDFALFTDQESGVNNPQFLTNLGNFVDWLRSQPEVDHVNTITDVFKRLNRNMHGDDPNYYRLPDNQELAAQYLLMYEFSLPFGLDLNNQLNLDKSATRLVVTLKNQGSKEFTAFEQRVIAWVSENMPGVTLTTGSVTLMFAHIGEANMASMIQGSIVALVLISGLLVLALRSWRMGAISLLPNLLPAAIGFGIWGAMFAEINMGLSVVLSMTMGIVVDDTVHFLSKYNYARTSGKNASESVRYAFVSVGHALWVTTLVLTIGFGVLAMSSFALNSDMGLLTGIIIMVALVVDFLFLPAFLIAFDNKDTSSEGQDNAKPQIQTA